MRKETNPIILANNIKQYLEKSGMKRSELARKTYTSEVSITRYCSGQRHPDAYTIYRMAKALGCTVADLMKGVDEETCE